MKAPAKVSAGLWELLGVAMLLLLPVLGVRLAGLPLSVYLEFPPVTRQVAHAPFSWWIFAGMAAVLLAFVWLVGKRVSGVRFQVSGVRCQEAGGGRGFPWWGWAGVTLGIAAWVLAWTRFPWFTGLQIFTFTPQWLAYVVVVNALTYRRSGRCMLVDRPLHMFRLFIFSAAFWWFFEYLNRFVQNWHYAGIGTLAPWKYFLFATLPFSTVLPAVMSTSEWLATFPRLTAGLEDMPCWSPRRPRLVSVVALILSGAGLAGIGVFPDLLFPLLWVSPLVIIVALQSLSGRETVLVDMTRGDWRQVVRLALAALVCGVFWELWNYHSMAKWIYTVPYVNRFKVFEMPVLGYAGYLPFGLECAVIAGLVERSGGIGGHGRWRSVALVVVALTCSALVWLPCLHLFFRPDLEVYRQKDGMPREAEAMARRHLGIWSDAALREKEISVMRFSNAEWDFMGRTFLVLALGNMGLREPERKQEYLAVMDAILDETLRLEKERGKFHFLMDYARNGSFVAKGGRSMFQDGEIALMLAVRRLVAEKPEYADLLRQRVDTMAACMAESPVLSGESYPDECWTFCNVLGLTAMRIHDVLDGRDHHELIERWLAVAKERLTDKRTGLLISSYSFSGDHYDGPEGSTIWMVAHCLQLLDPAFAADQYSRARRELGRDMLGFGYAREWPVTWCGPADVDSGPIIPLLGASAGSSGLALVGAAAFGDDAYLRQLLTSLSYGGFPVRDGGRLRYCASNQVGDAVILYAMVLGPAWEDVVRRERRHP